MKRAPLPWKSEGLRIFDSEGNEIAKVERIESIEDYKEQRKDAEARAKLITACVNACAEINPEAIPEFYRAALDFIECVGHTQEAERLNDLIDAANAMEKA